jgi:hypothetical protein
MANAQGSWSGAKFELEGMVGDKQTFEDAKEFYRNINAGKIKADHSRAGNEVTGNDDGGVGEGGEAENF